jgi:hypothetical protein
MSVTTKSVAGIQPAAEGPQIEEESKGAARREQVCSRLKKQGRRRRAWQPGGRDHLIYQWVKFDGQTQVHTANDFGISQATVSRIIDRYERWQAHAGEREGGRLDTAERRRAQRWLTYERNERILASALRIADRMEGVTDLRKSVRSKPNGEWYREGTETRTEERDVDRHGVAARFLRLAFRVNMEQLKLVEQDPPEMPEPLSEEDLTAEEARDAAVAADLAAAVRRGEEQLAEMREREQQAQVVRGTPDPAPELTGGLPSAGDLRSTDAAGSGDPRRTEGLGEENSVKLHNVHSKEESNIAATVEAACTCAADHAIQKTASDACIPLAGTDFHDHGNAAPAHFSGWAACPTGGG